MMPSIRDFAACVMACGLLTSATVNAADYTIGVLAKNGPAKAVAQWGGTASYLSETVPGDSFSIVPLDFAEVFPAVERGEVDFFLVNSSMFVTAKLRYAAEPIATMINSRQGKPLNSFGGVILTYVTNDDINSLADVKGKRFMAVNETSFGGWQMAYKEFLDQGIDPRTEFAALEFGGKHDNVVLAVQNGETDVGTVRTDTLERMAATGDIDLSEFKILNKQDHAGFPFVVSTSLYPEWPFAKISATASEAASKVAEALLALPKDHPAAKAAKVVGWSAPSDYAPVESLQQSLSAGATE